MRKLNKTHRTFEGTQCLSVSRTAHRLPWCCCWVLNSTDGGVPHSELEQEFTLSFLLDAYQKGEKKEKREAAEEAWRVIEHSKKKVSKKMQQISISTEKMRSCIFPHDLSRWPCNFYACDFWHKSHQCKLKITTVTYLYLKWLPYKS